MIDLGFLVGCLILGVIGWFIYKTYIWEYYISPLRTIPGPPSESLFYGNLKTLLTDESSEIHHRWIKEHGNLVRYHAIFNRTILLVADTKMVQEIVNQAYDFPKPKWIVTFSKQFVGYSLSLIEGETHKRQRKMMNPAFAHNNIKDMTPTFIRVARTLRDLTEEKVNKGESQIILTPYISKATLDIIGLVGFNHEFNSLTSPSEMAEAYDTLTNAKPVGLRIFLYMLSGFFPFVRKIPITMNRKFNHAVKFIDRETKKLVKKKYNDDQNNGKDLLSLLFNINKTLPIEERMTDDELSNQIKLFLFAGHETTSSSVCWVLHALAQHPHEQDLNCIVKETLRLYPPVANVQRVNVENKVLCGHFIPKDTLLVIPMAAFHRLPSIWGPTADHFDPKRWLDPSLVKHVSNFNYLPFNTGIRSCIGSKIALTEIKILSSILVRNFVFQPVEGLHIKRTPDMICKPRPYLELMVSKVES